MGLHVSLLLLLGCPIAVAEMRVLGPQKLLDAHGGRPIDTAKFLYYGGSVASGPAVFVDGDEICERGCTYNSVSQHNCAELRSKIAGKIMVIDRAKIKCAITSTYPFLSRLGAIGLVSFSEYPDPGIGSFRHHTLDAEDYKERPLVMPDVTFRDVIRSARGCYTEYDTRYNNDDDEVDESQCIYGNCRKLGVACNENIVNTWRKISEDEEIILELGPPFRTMYRDTFTSWYWTVIFRITLPVLAFWTALNAGLQMRDSLREVAHRKPSSQENAKHEHGCFNCRLCPASALVASFTREGNGTSKRRAWGVGLIISIIEMPVMLILGVAFATGTFGPMMLPGIVHFITLNLLNNASNFSSLVLALHMRETLNAQDRRDKAPVSLWVQHPNIIAVALLIAAFFDIGLPCIYYDGSWALLTDNLSLPQFILLAYVISLVFLVLVGSFFVLASWRLMSPLLAHVLHPESHQASSVVRRKVQKLVVCLVASGVCMLISAIAMIALGVQLSANIEVREATFVTIVIYSFSRVGTSYFQVQSLSEPRDGEQRICFALPWLDDWKAANTHPKATMMEKNDLSCFPMRSSLVGSRVPSRSGSGSAPLESIPEARELAAEKKDGSFGNDVESNLNERHLPYDDIAGQPSPLPNQLWGADASSIDALALKSNSSSGSGSGGALMPVKKHDLQDFEQHPHDPDPIPAHEAREAATSTTLSALPSITALAPSPSDVPQHQSDMW